MQKNINGNMLRKMLLAGASLLEENKNYLPGEKNEIANVTKTHIY